MWGNHFFKIPWELQAYMASYNLGGVMEQTMENMETLMNSPMN